MYKMDLEKADEPEIKLPTSVCWIIEKAREFKKKPIHSFTDYETASDCMDTNKLWKLLKEMDYQTTLPVSWETCTQVKNQ